tara:strand:+ start:12502 stop:13887 length:1386 start_codon:yes stop_codon:yes gene_type:complete
VVLLEYTLLVASATVLAFVVLGVLYSRGRVKTVEDYVVARRSLGIPGAIGTCVASGLGAWILFSPPEAAITGGLIALIGYGIGSATPLLAFAYLGPRIIKAMPGGASISEYVNHRYGTSMRYIVAGVSTFYMFIFLSAELTAISLAFNLVAGVPLVITALLVGGTVVAYTAYGGLRASLFTDRVQAGAIIVLLTIIVGWTLIITELKPFIGITSSHPHLIDLGFPPGVEFAIVLVVAIPSANLFHQGYWQRLYACKDERVIRIGFLTSSVVVVPIVVLAGLLGLVAIGLNLVEHPSLASFALMSNLFSDLLVLLMLILALALVSSSLDTLFNGLASLFSFEFSRSSLGANKKTALTWARIATIIIAAPTIAIASQGLSVLYLFLVADLICAAAVAPVYSGLISKKITSLQAAVAFGLGLTIGVPLFMQNMLLQSFILAFFVPIGILASIVLVKHKIRQHQH